MKRKVEESQSFGRLTKKISKNNELCCCLLDLNYSSNLLSSKIADIPIKLKYETILAPIFEYCFGTSDQDQVWEELNEEDAYESNNYGDIINLQIDWIRDETFIYSQIYYLIDDKLDILARKFGLWNNRKFILNSSSNLFYWNEQFRNDRQFIMEILCEGAQNIEYLSYELRNDKEIIMKAVKHDGYSFRYASKELQDDKEVLLLALESCSNAYNYASDRLKNDREIVFKAVFSCGLSILKVSEVFNNDRELLLKNAKIDGLETLHFASYNLRNDKELILEAIQQNPLTFRFASDKLKSDREFVQKCVIINGECLAEAPIKFLKDKEMVELALKSSPDIIHCISYRLRNDMQFISKIIGKRGFRVCPTEFSNDREIVLESIKLDAINLERASNALQNDREFILHVVKNCGMAIQFVNEEFQNDREIITEAIIQNGNAIRFVRGQYFDDKELIIKAAHYFTSHNLKFRYFDKISETFHNDRELLMKCGPFFQLFPRKYQLDREIVMECLKTNPDLVIVFAYPLIARDRVLAMRIVKRDGLILDKLPPKFQNDREIVSFAIQQNKEAFKFASDELQNDFEILKLIKP